MEKIVVGLDGSPTAEAALRWTTHLAKAAGAEIVAVNAYANPYSEVRPDTHDRLVAERNERMALWSSPATEAGVPVRVVVRDGDARDVVLNVADAEDADLVVLGRIGEGGGPGFLHLGSVVEHAIHHSSRPLAVIPRGWAQPTTQVLLGIDGSEGSFAAVNWLADIGRSLQLSVTAVAVEEPIAEWTPSTSSKNWRRDVEKWIGEWTGPLSDAGVTVEAVAQRDLHPSAALLGTATSKQADLIVVGTRGLGGFSGLRAGGTALKLIHHSTLPIVLVPVS